ncbi:hypothetical protein BOH78_4805 [Pichia kudriavzevii]|uniref:Uncharacterized protein n=1 Tax=Pichia kudriavzevii TaxID=4909 RepID=A0A1V2LG34_PICKU|nr:hypothetical protein BOH78_4805 [Pichia kudriavzevii]
MKIKFWLPWMSSLISLAETIDLASLANDCPIDTVTVYYSSFLPFGNGASKSPFTSTTFSSTLQTLPTSNQEQPSKRYTDTSESSSLEGSTPLGTTSTALDSSSIISISSTSYEASSLSQHISSESSSSLSSSVEVSSDVLSFSSEITLSQPTSAGTSVTLQSSLSTTSEVTK